MNWIDDLLYAPIRPPTKGVDMEAKEYGEKVSALGSTETNIEHTASRLSKAIELLADWKNSTAPLSRGAAARALHTAPWMSLDEINNLIERYWREHQEVADGWKELSEETRNTLIALGVKPPEGAAE